MTDEPQYEWTTGRIVRAVLVCLAMIPGGYLIGRGRQYSDGAALVMGISLCVLVGGFLLLWILGVRAFGYDFGTNTGPPYRVAAWLLQVVLIVAGAIAAYAVMLGPE